MSFLKKSAVMIESVQSFKFFLLHYINFHLINARKVMTKLS
jgi:hypothetical protein